MRGEDETEDRRRRKKATACRTFPLTPSYCDKSFGGEKGYGFRSGGHGLQRETKQPHVYRQRGRYLYLFVTRWITSTRARVRVCVCLRHVREVCVGGAVEMLKFPVDDLHAPSSRLLGRVKRHGRLLQPT